VSAVAARAERIRQLDRLLRIDAAVAAASMMFLIVVHVTVSTSDYVLLLAGCVGIASTCMLLGLVPLRRGNVSGALLMLALANWGIALVGTAIAPFAMPVLVIASLLPAALAIPYVDRAELRGYVITTVLVASAVVALGTLQEETDIEDSLPSWMPTLVTLTFTPVMAGLIAFVAYQSVEAVTKARDDAVAASEELVQAQARIVTASDDARRSIERDLHDGAQQRLTAVAIQLGRVHTRAERDGDPLADNVGQIRKDLADARAELRRLAHGLYPSSLAVHGLEMALRSEADRFARPIRITTSLGDELPLPVETAIYFCCLEAIQNASVHAGDDARIGIDIAMTADGSVQFSVRDDGKGFDTSVASNGHGFQNMRDRVGAFGGRLEITSDDGHGTTVQGWIPLP
jgi:signal transduction histidine kinase